jgi:hypothetical protein
MNHDDGTGPREPIHRALVCKFIEAVCAANVQVFFYDGEAQQELSWHSSHQTRAIWEQLIEDSQ